jgi:signal transduction histidine kinase
VLAALTPVEAPSWDLLFQRVASQPGRGIADDEMPQPSPVTTEASGPHGRQYLVHLVPMRAPAGPDDEDVWPDEVPRLGGVIVCATDVTELRHAEMQRQELMAFIAHDIRSPQASLLALVELQQMGHGPSPDEALQHIESLARSTLDLCEELLQVMRAENRPVTLQRTDLHSLADECIDEVSLRAQLKDITLQRTWDGERRQPAVVDDYLVHRALVNLLGNAVKFGPAHSTVTVSIATQEGHHVIAVEDQGPGIPTSELGRLFRRYERGEQGRPARLPPGIGLGLVFIDTVARRHGGRVVVDNRPGSGARFALWLPVASAAPTAAG